ncbi:hypothetical protein ACTXT7_000716 [Hymenolepis weldensis]
MPRPVDQNSREDSNDCLTTLPPFRFLNGYCNLPSGQTPTPAILYNIIRCDMFKCFGFKHDSSHVRDAQGSLAG